jgi:acyl-CoA thioester hydrolase
VLGGLGGDLALATLRQLARPAMILNTPFARHEAEVRADWIDANGHMNLAYYVVVFDHATDAIFDALGMGDAYRETSGHAVFAVETHTLYGQELRLGERVRVATLVLGSDSKRLHLAHEMFHAATGTRAAAQEIMFLHVDLSTRRTAPFPAALRERLEAAARGHAAARPDWIGRRISLPG